MRDSARGKVGAAMQTKLRSAADLMREAKREAAEMLFDEFWRQGEIALLFGEAGVGKSLIAVQAANAIAGGKPFGGLSMPTKGRRVLYVDLVLSDAQFRYRYAHGPTRGRMTFSRNFLYERPPHGADVVQWIRETIEANSIDCVVIDDLNALLRTSYSARDAIALMTELRRLVCVNSISVLVLADSRRYPKRSAGVDDLRRLRGVCDLADTVIAMTGNVETNRRSLTIVRSRVVSSEWTVHAPLRLIFAETEAGQDRPEFAVAQRTFDADLINIIERVKEMHDEDEMSFRSIADELDISKSKAQRLYALWSTIDFGDEDDDEDEQEESSVAMQKEEKEDDEDKFRYGNEAMVVDEDENGSIIEVLPDGDLDIEFSPSIDDHRDRPPPFRHYGNFHTF